MLGAIGGGDPFEIIVALKDLSEAGFRKVEGNIHHVEAAANGTNLKGFSKATQTAEKDAEKLAGKSGKGGIGGVASALLGLGGGPVTVALAALGGLSVAGLELTKTYEEVEVQEKALEIAAKDHGIALDDLNKHVDESITANEQYGIGASDTRGAIIKLTEAGMSLADQQQAMGPIADLAKAKNISLTEAAKVYELAIMGNAKALKEYGIALPKVTSAQKAQDTAQRGVTVASNNLSSAQAKLKLLEDQLAGKHKLTAADADRLRIAHQKVKSGADALKMAHEKLTAAQAKGNTVGDRAKLINDSITKAVGDQRNAVSPLQVAQSELGDAWQRLAVGVGPGLEDLFARLVQGVAKFIDIIMHALGALGDLFGLIGKVGSAIANSPIGSVAGAAGNIAGGIAGAAGNVLGTVGSWLPHFASGGIVEPRPGGRMIIAGDSGEREFVIPESRMGGLGGGTVHHHFHLSIDGRDLAFALEPILGQQLALQGTSTGNGSI